MKPYFIIGDSSTDLSPELEKQLPIAFAPLTITIDNKDYFDDQTLNLREMIDHMKNSKNSPKTACPSPDQYYRAIKDADASVTFIVTLSSALSGSYNSACISRDMYMDEFPDRTVYVVDSKSASSGQGLLTTTIHELMEQGMEPPKVYEAIQDVVSRLQTIFVLERLDNLRKNGRLGLIASAIVTILSIKLILGATENGEIKMINRAKGIKKALSTMVDQIVEDLNGRTGERLYIAHCLNEERAKEVYDEVKAKCQFKDIQIVPMRGLSGNYADEGGIVIGYY